MQTAEGRASAVKDLIMPSKVRTALSARSLVYGGKPELEQVELNFKPAGRAAPEPNTH